MPKYRKKPVVIEAHQWDGTAEAATPIIDWVLANGHTARYRDAIEPDGPALRIDTLEGTMTARPGWWIIKGVAGEFYPCEPEIFSKTYSASVEDSAQPMPGRIVDIVHAAILAAGKRPSQIAIHFTYPDGAKPERVDAFVVDEKSVDTYQAVFARLGVTGDVSAPYGVPEQVNVDAIIPALGVQMVTIATTGFSVAAVQDPAALIEAVDAARAAGEAVE